ncbi:tyrosine-type recombinase/integrase [Streptomyces sp. CPS1]
MSGVPGLLHAQKDPISGKRERTARYDKGKRYKVAGIPGIRDRSFDTLEDAKAWLRRAATDEERGGFVDPRDGSITLADYIMMHWAPGKGGVPKTQDNQERRVRLHIVPHLGERPLRNITAADLRAYIAKLEATVSSVDYRRGILSELSSIVEAAVDDKRLARNPMHAKSVRWPKAPQERREAWPLERALRVRDAISPRNRIAVVVGLGCGLRRGVRVEPGGHRLRARCPPCTPPDPGDQGKAVLRPAEGSQDPYRRHAPSVAEELKRHVEAFPPVEVELPWGKPEGQRRKFSLPFTTRLGNAVAVNTWNPYTWKPALAEAGIIPPRAEGAKPWQWAAAPKDGFHVLRHTYASIMLEAGESVVALARWLGHSSPAITLGYYAHFMPAAGSKGRTAIDGLLGRQGHLHAGQNSPDSPQDRWRAIPTVAPP